MERKYGDEQRKAIRGIKDELIKKIENLFLKTFEELDAQGLGDGSIASLTQELLIAREAAITSLKA